MSYQGAVSNYNRLTTTPRADESFPSVSFSLLDKEINNQSLINRDDIIANAWNQAYVIHACKSATPASIPRPINASIVCMDMLLRRGEIFACERKPPLPLPTTHEPPEVAGAVAAFASEGRRKTQMLLPRIGALARGLGRPRDARVFRHRSTHLQAAFAGATTDDAAGAVSRCISTSSPSFAPPHRRRSRSSPPTACPPWRPSPPTVLPTVSLLDPIWP